MNQILLKKISLCAVILGILAVGAAFAQQPTPSPKRNSPFAPNPKKKTEANPTAQISDSPKTVPGNEAKIVDIKAEKQPNENLLNQIETPKTGVLDPPVVNENQNFESRSVAKKTLEVAKRASTVEPPPTEIYKVGIGDILFISLQNAPAKETTYFTVLTDGNIDYPLAGGMTQVLGLTTEQIEDLLKEKIKLYENPQVAIKVREHNSHTFTVAGLVDEPGQKTMEREAIPLFLVQTKTIVNQRANELVIKRGLEKQVVDLKDTKAGDVLIYPGDILEFRANDETAALSRASQFYFIGGEINSGGRKDYIKGITLTQAILESGGLKKSNVKKVVIRRKNAAGMLVPAEYDLKAIKDGKAVDPSLEAGDTIEIGN